MKSLQQFLTAKFLFGLCILCSHKTNHGMLTHQLNELEYEILINDGMLALEKSDPDFDKLVNEMVVIKAWYEQEAQQSLVDDYNSEISDNIQEENLNIKRFHCDTCGKKFTQKIGLRIHLRIHTGEKPYECPTCHKRFTQACNLVRHFDEVHTGEKPFECKTCGKKFKRKNYYNRHLKIH